VTALPSGAKFFRLLAFVLIAAAYLLGAIPFGLILARSFAGVDVRTKGSGNIGATNVARTSGKGLGIATLVLDAAKGAAPVLVSTQLDQPLEIIAGCGMAAVVGHVFPIWLKLRGGKGVATGAGVFLAISPISASFALGAFAIVFAIARVVSVASLCGSAALLVAVYLADGRREVIALAAGVVALIAVRHAGNITRLLRRAENRL
jgi:acyl phosphate:glycerol-3-phosphate acyltransferase